MASGNRTQFFLFRTPGRLPLYTDRPPFWQRVLSAPSALGVIVLATALAAIVALVATLVYATVDAGRPLEGGPTTIADASGDATPSVVITEPQVTTTKPPEVLSPDALAKKLSGSVRSVKTLDEAGQPVEGTAFVVGSFGGQTLFLTSLALVRSGTRAPAPPIALGDNRQATLWTWDEPRDLALLVIGGIIESLPWVTANAGPKQGERLFTSNGSKLVAGVILASSAAGIEHNIFVDDRLQGAPLVNQKGEVLAMASSAYNPGGKGTDTVFTGVPIGLACEQVLRCGSGNTTASSTSPTSTP